MSKTYPCPKCKVQMLKITQPDGKFLLVCRKCRGHRGPFKGKLSHLPDEVREEMRK
ncbi:MAG: hypothetical protein ABH950_07040 [Candidatus Altiarchaeota archaeon]